MPGCELAGGAGRSEGATDASSPAGLRTNWIGPGRAGGTGGVENAESEFGDNMLWMIRRIAQ